MNNTHNPELRSYAQNLRKHMTKEERHLWYDFLKSLPVSVHRQKVIGSYIVDFCIPAARLIVELDGSQHYLPDGQNADCERDAFLADQGYYIVRYANSDVNQHFEAVCQDILNHINI